MTLTLLQARYIQWLTLNGCSLRATAGNFFGRYNVDGSFKGMNDYDGWGGNQLDGIFLREDAIEVLKSHGVEPFFDRNGTDIGYGADSYDKWRKEMKAKRPTNQ